jgi:hypothetical protein
MGICSCQSRKAWGVIQESSRVKVITKVAGTEVAKIGVANTGRYGMVKAVRYGVIKAGGYGQSSREDKV